jgi:geranylgeranyl diphosphate synthase, type I
MSLESSIQIMLPAIEHELQNNLEKWIPAGENGLRKMLAYHMGWEGEGAGTQAQGKRIRSLLLLLCCGVLEENWEKALPAAAAVEYIHNFSLIHDDIQDKSQIRRGRQTVWVNWGIPQAINAGDLMFSLAFLTLSRLQETTSIIVSQNAANRLQQTCIELIQGQYLDLSYEDEENLSLQDYWPMINGKTAALLGCCTELGALVAGADAERCKDFNSFGKSLGLAFQVVDDWLGIWGNPALTGKATDSDLVSGKKTIPILYALQQGNRFAERWASGPIRSAEVEELAGLLTEEGAQEYTQEKADELTRRALLALSSAVKEENQSTAALREMADRLLQRQN